MEDDANMAFSLRCVLCINNLESIKHLFMTYKMSICTKGPFFLALNTHEITIKWVPIRIVREVRVKGYKV